MKVQLRNVEDHGIHYTALAFICPGCSELHGGGSGLHMLPVNSPQKTPSWDWDGDLEAPTLPPSIATRTGNGYCHSWLRGGVFEFLDDSAHSMAGQRVPMPDLPDWVVRSE